MHRHPLSIDTKRGTRLRAHRRSGGQPQACQCTGNSGEPQMSEGHTTTDHEKIKKWAKDRDGVPATVKETEKNGHAGILRIDFGPREKGLEEISWEDFFRKFEEANLAFLYQDKTKDGKVSRFHKFVARDRG